VVHVGAPLRLRFQCPDDGHDERRPSAGRRWQRRELVKKVERTSKCRQKGLWCVKRGEVDGKSGPKGPCTGGDGYSFSFGQRIEGSPRWSLRLFGGFELNALPGGERVVVPGKRERVLLPISPQPERQPAAPEIGDPAVGRCDDETRSTICALVLGLAQSAWRYRHGHCL